jgi:hypothetical protein
VLFRSARVESIREGKDGLKCSNVFLASMFWFVLIVAAA